jgi:CubicO group peptidase (beta-lactamase class C family)
VLRDLVEEAISEGVFPGAAYATHDEVGYGGRFTYDFDSPSVTADTHWDLASLTKVLVTTTLVARRNPDLDKVLPEGYSIRQLLLHNSGLAAFRRYSPGTDVLGAIREETLNSEPGEKTVYSDLGFLRLQAWLQESGVPLDRQLRELGLHGLTYDPPKEQCAPTSPETMGVVHDPTARLMGGVAGHAGAFGRLSDVVEFLEKFPPPSEWTTRQHQESTRGLGWDTVLTTDDRVFESAWGHTGFTGTSIWRWGDRWAVLLANRTYPTDDNPKILAFRRRFYAAAFG